MLVFVVDGLFGVCRGVRACGWDYGSGGVFGVEVGVWAGFRVVLLLDFVFCWRFYFRFIKGGEESGV